VIIHTAGVSSAMASAERILQINLLGTAHLIDAFAPLVGVGSSMVCVASITGHMVNLPAELEDHLAHAPAATLLDHPDLSSDVHAARAYGLAKRSNLLRVQSHAGLFGSRGARLNSISPGVIATRMGRLALEDGTGARQLIDSSASARVGTSEEVAAAAAFLAGPDASFVCGTDLLVDGGELAGWRWPSAELP
jgi:NAD(P)-dependent dehydrogenase (short-subunit alcohol dehydrogenase family)